MPLRLSIAVVATLALAACGSEATPGPSAGSTRAALSAPTPAATPAASPSLDAESVQILKTGVGAYLLQAEPVAILHNTAADHTAQGVVVHFAVPGSGATFSIDAGPVSMAPGETVAVAALCTDRCNRATRTEATVSVAAWPAGTRPTIAAGAAAYRCGVCGRGSGYGSVSAALIGKIDAGRAVIAVAACTDAAGAIVGGGSAQMVWPPAPDFSVPVLVSSAPAGCQVYASLI